MASDLKIEIFAYSLFRRLMSNIGEEKEGLNILQIYGKECRKVENIFQAREEILIAGIELRRQMFISIYMPYIVDEKVKKLKSFSAFYDYITSICDRSDLFGHLPVFERMFSTFGFVFDFCVYVYSCCNVSILEHGHIFWAMYFDKFTKEFYEEGGWEQLKKLAETYCKIANDFYYFEVNLHVLKEALENYCKFKDDIHYNEYKSKLKKKVHVSKLWIKYRIEQLDCSFESPLVCQYSIDAIEAEKVLDNLIKLHERWLEESALSAKTCAENATDYADNKINDSDLQIQDLPCMPPVKKLTDTYVDDLYSKNPETICESLNTSNALDSNQRDESLSCKNFPLYKIPDTILCSENRDIYESNKKGNREKYLEACCFSKKNNQAEIARKMDITSESQINKFGDERNDSTCILPTQKFIDQLDSSGKEHTNETPIAPEVLLTDQADKSLHSSKSPSNITKTMKFILERENVNDNADDVSYKDKDFSRNGEKLSKEKSMKMSHYSKNKEVSSNQITKPDNDGNFSSCIDPTQQFIDSYIDQIYSSSKEHETPIAPEVLLTDQVDKSLHYKNSPSNTTKTKKNILENENVNYNAEDVSCEDKDFSRNGEKLSKEKSMKMSHYSKNGEVSSNQITKPDNDGNCSSCIDPTQQFIDSFIDKLYLSSKEHKSETPIAPEVLLTDQADKSLHYKNSPSNTTKTKKIILENENVNDNAEDVSYEDKDFSRNGEKLSKEKSMKMSPYSKNGEVSSNQITKPDAEENSCIDPIQQFMDSYIDQLYSSSKEHQNETLIAPEVMLTEQIDKSFYSIQKDKNASNFISKNQNMSIKDAEVNNVKNFKGDAQTEVIEGEEINLGHEMAASKCNAKTTPDILKSKVLQFVNNNGDNVENIEKARMDFKKEQNDRDIKIFLRMILILNDRQGTKLVLQMLQGNEEGPENMQSVANKQKKKSKKKNSKKSKIVTKSKDKDA